MQVDADCRIQLESFSFRELVNATPGLKVDERVIYFFLQLCKIGFQSLCFMQFEIIQMEK